MAAVNFSGRWKEGEGVNKEEFCREWGLSPEMSKAFGAMKAVLEIVHDGDNFHVKEIGPDGTVLIDEKCTINVPYKPKEVPPGAKEIEYMYKWEQDGKVLKSTGLDPDFKPTTGYQFGENGALVVISTVNDLTCTIHYTKE